MTRSENCNERCTGRPRLIPDDGSTRCTTRSIAGMCWSARGLMCAATAARLASTRKPSPMSRSTGSPGCSTWWPRISGSIGGVHCRRVGFGSTSPARPNSGRFRSRWCATASCRRLSRSSSSRSLKPTFCRARSGSARSERRTTPCRSSLTRLGRGNGGWWSPTSLRAWMRHHTAPLVSGRVRTALVGGWEP